MRGGVCDGVGPGTANLSTVTLAVYDLFPVLMFSPVPASQARPCDVGFAFRLQLLSSSVAAFGLLCFDRVLPIQRVLVRHNRQHSYHAVRRQLAFASCSIA